MKIFFLLCHSSSKLHGEIREAIIAQELVKAGHDARVLRMRGGIKSMHRELFGEAVPVNFFPVDDEQADIHNMVSAALLDYLCSERPDIILLKGIDYRIAEAVLNRVDSLRTTIGFIIGGVSVHPLLKFARIVLTESESQSNEVTNYLEGRAYVKVLNKYIDFSAIDEMKTLQEPIKIYDIVNVGYFEERKNQIALSAFFGRYKIAYIGHGPMLSEVKQAADGFLNVSFLGTLDNREVLRVIGCSRLMVHTSLWEGVPRVLMESLACGCPVVAFRSAIQAKIATPAVRLIEQEDLRSSVDGLLDDPSTLMQLASDGLAFMQTFYGPDAFAEIAKDIASASMSR